MTKKTRPSRSSRLSFGHDIRQFDEYARSLRNYPLDDVLAAKEYLLQSGKLSPKEKAYFDKIGL